ncbi:MAG: ATP-binding protein [Lachnospiraceae bacterium]
MERYKEIERTIVKTYRKDIWGRFVKAVEKYQLIENGDCIAVCVSGGKDSALLAKLMQLYQSYGGKKFEVRFISMDPGYSEENRRRLEENSQLLNIPLEIFSTDVFDAVEDTGTSPCFICARMRRGYLYRKAKAAGCNKIALGHHYDDVIETILMGMLYGAQIQTMLPKLMSDNVEGMELIRPMYLIREQDVLAWAHYNELHFLQCACAATRNNDNRSFTTKRAEIKQLIASLKENNPLVESNIFGSVENVNLRKILGYQKDGEKRTFLDDYRK